MAGLDEEFDFSFCENSFLADAWSVEPSSILDDNGVTACITLFFGNTLTGEMTSVVFDARIAGYLGLDLLDEHINR